MNTHLHNRDVRVLWVCLGIVIISLVIILSQFKHAFPEASIRFKINKDQAKQIAVEFLDDMGLDFSGYRHATIFDYDNRAKTYLEKELGASGANQVMGSQVRIWQWSNRWYQPLEKREITVNISPQGELLGFTRILPEDMPGDSLAADSAQVLALAYLTGCMHINPDSIRFVESSSQERPQRLDHSYTWQLPGFTRNGAEYRCTVTIQGSQVGGYREYLHIPESWLREYEQLRARNNITGYVASFFLFLTLLAMLGTMIRSTRHLDVQWKTALLFGGIAAVLMFLSRLNELPLEQYYYNTTESWSGYLVKHALTNLVMALLTGMGIFFLTAAGEPLYRERYGSQLALGSLLTRRGVRSKSFFIASIVGFTMTFAFIAYQVAFYLAADKLGGWAPQDIPYSNMLNTTFPWIYILLSGFIPAVSEEFISRMFSIPFLHKYIKSRWLAVLIPAFIWGFAHANYAQEPFYIRGLEVGLAGIAIGFIMLRFGILAPLVWHYSIDAVYTALVLVRSGHPYYIITALIGSGILLLPFIYALIAWLKTGRFSDVTDLTNTAQGTVIIPHAGPETPQPPKYNRLSRPRIIITLVITILISGLFLLKSQHFGNFARYPTSPKQAKQAANAFLTAQSVSVDSFQTVVRATDRYNPFTAKYVLEKDGLERLNTLYGKQVRAHRWVVRYFQPLRKQEYRIHLDPRDLSVLAYIREIDENAPGDSLSPDSAQTLARQYIAGLGIDLARYELADAASEQLPNRTDHRFVWKSVAGDSMTLEDMHVRMSVDVQGSEIAGFNRYPQIPEDWQRSREKQTLLNSLHLGLRIALVLVLFGISIMRFINLAQVGTIYWKRSLIIAGMIAALFLTDALSRFNLSWLGYNTSMEPALFTIANLLSIVLSGLALFAGLVMLLSMTSALYPGSLHVFQSPDVRDMVRDALFTAIISLVGLLAINQLLGLLAARFPQYATITELPVPAFIDAPLPLFSNLAHVIYMGLFTALGAGLLVFVLAGVFRKPVFMVLFTLFLSLAMVSMQARSFGEVLMQLTGTILVLGWLAFVVVYLARNNILAYLYSGLVVIGFSQVYDMVVQGNKALAIQGIALALILFITLFYLILYWSKSSIILKNTEQREHRP